MLDEYYWLNKEDPNSSLCRATVNRGEDAHTDGKFAISDKGAMEIMRLFFTPDEQLQDKRITDFFDDEVFSSNFWLYWRTMFAFENWHSALEMKLYIKRYIHHIGGLPDFKALRFTRYNQYESIILPMTSYLKSHGVQFFYNTKVVDVKFDIKGERKQASSIVVESDGQQETINLTENDLLFITNGGCVENSSIGSQNEAAEFDPELKPGNGWDLWKKIAAQDPSFGHPDKFMLRRGADQLGERDHHHAGRQDPAVHSEDLQARSVHRPHRHRRHCHREGFQLADELDAQPSAAVPRPAARTSCASGSTRCSPISRATMSRSPCVTAPARKSAWSGCITSACRRTRSKSWRRRAPTPCRS